MKLSMVAKFGLIALLCCAFAKPASAAIVTYGASLSGLQEAPPNGSPAIGTVFVTYDSVLETLRVQASFSGLLGNTTAAHIHAATAAPFTGTAGVATTTPSFVGFPLGVKNGSMDQTYDLTLASSFNAAFVTANGGTVSSARTALINAINGNRAYFNIHTASFGGGEVRGFLVQGVPEPSSMALLGSFAAAAGWRSWRRRKTNAQK